MLKATLRIESIYLASLHVHRLENYQHGRGHGDMQADMVLEQELRGLHTDP